MIRITADLDNTLLSIAIFRTQAVIDYIYKEHEIIIYDKIIRKSFSGKGCHVILFSDNKLSKWDIFYIRLLLGDDCKRVKKDLLRRRPKQYLFKEKIKLVTYKK